jgi:hypothetical protein
MKNFNQFCRKGFAMWILVLALACPALAGDIPYPGVATPPQAATGDIQFPGVASHPETINGEIPFPGVALDFTEGIALTLWQSVLSLF